MVNIICPSCEQNKKGLIKTPVEVEKEHVTVEVEMMGNLICIDCLQEEIDYEDEIEEETTED